MHLIAEAIRTFAEPSDYLECETKLSDLVQTVLSFSLDAPPPKLKLGKEHRDSLTR